MKDALPVLRRFCFTYIATGWVAIQIITDHWDPGWVREAGDIGAGSTLAATVLLWVLTLLPERINTLRIDQAERSIRSHEDRIRGFDTVAQLFPEPEPMRRVAGDPRPRHQGPEGSVPATSGSGQDASVLAFPPRESPTES